MNKNIIISGAMGSGKSTVLQLFEAQGFHIIREPAREILAEQRSIGGEGVPEKNPNLFIQLLLSRAIYQYKQMQSMSSIVVYDRGIPDNIAYAQLFGLDYSPAYHAANLYLYNSQVFIFPAWEEIYVTDNERIMSFAAAKAFGDAIQKVYKNLGYHLIVVPCSSPEERLQFITERIA